MNKKLLIPSIAAPVLALVTILLIIPAQQAESQGPFAVTPKYISANGVTWEITGGSQHVASPAIRGCVTHYDKIIFTVTPLSGQSLNSLVALQPVLLPGNEYDIKVVDNPNLVADIRDKVVKKLIAFGYKDGQNAITRSNINLIIDVDYAVDEECSNLDIALG